MSGCFACVSQFEVHLNLASAFFFLHVHVLGLYTYFHNIKLFPNDNSLGTVINTQYFKFPWGHFVVTLTFDDTAGTELGQMMSDRQWDLCHTYAYS